MARSTRWFLCSLSALLLLTLPSLWSTVTRAQQPGGLESLPAWGVVPSPNGGAGPNELADVVVLSPTDVWAVGNYGEFTHPRPAIHHWDGVQWQLAEFPAGTLEGELLGVAASSATDVWAVGAANSGGDSWIFHWDGTQWESMVHPQNHTRQRFYAVAALAPDDVWAVGDYSDNGGVSLSFAMHWDGVAWEEVSTPNPNGGYSALHGVVALASDDVWAVGDDGQEPRALHWDGNGWSIVPIPAQGLNTVYYGIAAVSATDIWAVGEGWDGQIASRWDGSQWQAVPNPAPASGFGQLEDVIALASDDVWAVGWFGSSPRLSYAMHWNGSSWVSVPPPSPDATLNGLYAVGGDAGNNVWAVGRAGGTLTVRWDGSAWAEIPGANAGSADNELLDVTVLAPNEAWAVGEADGDSLTLHWDGNAWARILSPTLSLGVTLAGVAGVAPDDVWAVGFSASPSTLDSETVTLHWDGVAWTRVASPNPGGDETDKLQAVAALPTGEVWAVGETGGTGESALVLRWAGSAWEVVATGCGAGLYAIDIRTPDDIWAVGDDTTCHYDGTSWTRFNPPSFPLLLGVTAQQPDAVWAVGQLTSCGSQSCSTSAYSARWTGSTWAQAPIPAASVGEVVALAPDNVYAVGTFSLGTALAHWDGSAWRNVPAPDPGAGGFLHGLAARGDGGLWAVGSYLTDGDYLERTLVLEAPSASQGSLFGNTTYGQGTVLWLGPVSGSTTTDSFGEYAAAGLPAGTYTLVATGEGCDPQSVIVQVYPGEHVRQDFDLCGPLPTPAPTRTPTVLGTPSATATPFPTSTATATSTQAPPTPTEIAATSTPTASPPAPIMFEPATVIVSQPMHQGGMAYVELHNMASAPLVWSAHEAGTECAMPTDIPWVRVEPMGGTVAVGEMVMLTIHLATEALPPGLHMGYLCVDDGGANAQVLPLQVTVMEQETEQWFLPLIGR